MALFGDEERERELIKSGLDLTGGMAWHDGYLTITFLKVKRIGQRSFQNIVYTRNDIRNYPKITNNPK